MSLLSAGVGIMPAEAFNNNKKAKGYYAAIYISVAVHFSACYKLFGRGCFRFNYSQKQTNI
jgi:hypothetical protein